MTKLAIIIATVVALLATALSPVQAQEQYAVSLQTTTVNDDPVLTDNIGTYNWYEPPADVNSTGYGANGFRFTAAIGNSETLDSWARWDFAAVDGPYEVQAWIPSQWATAHVQYNIWADRNGNSVFDPVEYVGGPWLDQQTNNGGWQSLGVHNLRGRVRIEVRDTLARDDHRDVGTENARIAADAIRLLRDGQTSSEEPPTPPRSVMAAPHSESSLRVTWSAPANSGSSPISGYEVEYSRDALRNHPVYGDRGPYNSGPVSVNGRSHTTGAFLHGVTYRVKVTALNGDGLRSRARWASARTRTTSPPSSPRDVRVVTRDGTIGVTWTAPARNGSSPISHYHIRYYRESSSGDIAWSDEDQVPAADRLHVNSRVGSGQSYDIELTAVNDDNQRSPTVELYAAALGVPEVTVEPEGRSWLIDDPDALILWDEVPRARAYQIDWRYMRIDTSRLRDIYNRLQNTNLSDDTKKSLSREAAELLEGNEISSSQFRGDSRPAPNGGNEVYCRNTTDSASRLCTNVVTWRTDRFDPDDPEYRIHSDQQDKVLQVRVRAMGRYQGAGTWSEWAYHPSSRFNAGCTFLDTYNTIRNVQSAVDTASVILTVGGVVGAVFTAGSTIAVSGVTKAALKFAAKEIVKLIIKRVTIRRFMVSLIKDLAMKVVEQSALELAGFTFGCLTHGANLQKGDAHALGEQFITEFKNAAIESLDWERALENWKRVEIK